jgi:hypothetical protein
MNSAASLDHLVGAREQLTTAHSARRRASPNKRPGMFPPRGAADHRPRPQWSFCGPVLGFASLNPSWRYALQLCSAGAIARR